MNPVDFIFSNIQKTLITEGYRQLLLVYQLGMELMNINDVLNLQDVVISTMIVYMRRDEKRKLTKEENHY